MTLSGYPCQDDRAGEDARLAAVRRGAARGRGQVPPGVQEGARPTATRENGTCGRTEVRPELYIYGIFYIDWIQIKDSFEKLSREQNIYDACPLI